MDTDAQAEPESASVFLLARIFLTVQKTHMDTFSNIRRTKSEKNVHINEAMSANLSFPILSTQKAVRS